MMDQLASACGVEGSALLIDLSGPITISPAKLPEDLEIVVCDTCEKHQLGTSGYAKRRAESEEAARAMGVPILGKANLPLLIANQSKMSAEAFRRARHIITENERCQAFHVALQVRDFTAIGELMHASHQSLKNDFEVTTSNLDLMAELGSQIPGCVGIRMTGGGFGGACVALVKSDAVDSFIEKLRASYAQQSGISGNFIRCHATTGAHLVS